MWIYVYIHLCIYLYIHPYTYGYIYAFLHIYAYIYIYIYLLIAYNICMYIYIYIYCRHIYISWLAMFNIDAQWINKYIFFHFVCFEDTNDNYSVFCCIFRLPNELIAVFKAAKNLAMKKAFANVEIPDTKNMKGKFVGSKFQKSMNNLMTTLKSSRAHFCRYIYIYYMYIICILYVYLFVCLYVFADMCRCFIYFYVYSYLFTPLCTYILYILYILYTYI